MRNARLDEAQAESRLPGEITDMQMTPLLCQKQRTKEPLDEIRRGD